MMVELNDMEYSRDFTEFFYLKYHTLFYTSEFYRFFVPKFIQILRKIEQKFLL